MWSSRFDESCLEYLNVQLHWLNFRLNRWKRWCYRTLVACRHVFVIFSVIYIGIGNVVYRTWHLSYMNAFECCNFNVVFTKPLCVFLKLISKNSDNLSVPYRYRGCIVIIIDKTSLGIENLYDVIKYGKPDDFKSNLLTWWKFFGKPRIFNSIRNPSTSRNIEYLKCLRFQFNHRKKSRHPKLNLTVVERWFSLLEAYEFIKEL